MTALTARRPPLALLATGLLVGAVVVGTRLAGSLAAPQGLDDPRLAAPPAAVVASSPDVARGTDPAVPAAIDPGRASSTGAGASSAGAATPVGTGTSDLAVIRADIDFWGARLEANAGDIVAAVKLAEADVAEARATGDVGAYVRAMAAADAGLASHPGYVPAQAAKASILVALHRFVDARDLAGTILADEPGNATALGVLGDASLELGDLAGAREAYTALGVVADGAAARVRAGRLAFVSGDPATAVAETRRAAAAAVDEGLEGAALAFYGVTLGELLRATGDEPGARAAYTDALDAHPGDPGALVGLARLDAFDGRLDDAIAGLDRAIAAIPQPDWLALRSDLLERRDGPGDPAAVRTDRATVEAIAALAGDAAHVYDRNLSLYLSDHGLGADRAVTLARDELAVRHDVYGYDALAWALLNAGRPDEARAPMASALAAGTQDARLFAHAGLIEAATGSTAMARDHLGSALALGPALDPALRARVTSVLEGLR